LHDSGTAHVASSRRRRVTCWASAIDQYRTAPIIAGLADVIAAAAAAASKL